MKSATTSPALTLTLSLSLLLSACASTGDGDSTTAADTPPAQATPAAASAPAAPSAPPAPSLSAAQSAQLDNALVFQTRSAVLRKIMDEARPNLREFLQHNACITDGDGSVLNSLAAPGASFPSSGYAAPMAALPAHDRSTCLSVPALRNVTALTLRSLRLEANYLSSGGESTRVRHELHKQADGKWLFVR